jgi:hypothetical protein
MAEAGLLEGWSMWSDGRSSVVEHFVRSASIKELLRRMGLSTQHDPSGAESVRRERTGRRSSIRSRTRSTGCFGLIGSCRGSLCVT